MTISLTLEAADVASLQRMCAELAHSGAPAEAIAAVVIPPEKVVDAPPNMKPGRKQKSTETAQAVVQPVEEMTQTAVSPPAAEASTGASTSAPTIDDVREKFRTLSTAQGLPAVTAILHTFKTVKDSSKKVERMSDLAPSDFAAVIAKVDAALKG